MQEPLQHGHDYIRTDNLLLGLLRESGGIAARDLINLGVDPDEALRETRKILRTRAISEEAPWPRYAGSSRKPHVTRGACRRSYILFRQYSNH
jgi:hypothetical protein